jgi:hypothetical protein
MQYVLEIRDTDGWLQRSFIVTEESPIPAEPDDGCTQVVMTNTINYNAIGTLYYQYGEQLSFTYNDINETISCIGPESDTWDID